MIGIYIAIASLAMTILGLVVKLTSFNTEIRVWVNEMREEIREDRRVLRRIPTLELRIAFLEKHLDLSAPRIPDNHHDAE